MQKYDGLIPICSDCKSKMIPAEKKKIKYWKCKNDCHFACPIFVIKRTPKEKEFLNEIGFRE